MTMCFCRATLVILSMMFGVMLAPANATEPTGTWFTQNADARIRVTRCGNDMCGTIVWLKDAIDAETGKPQVQREEEE